MEAGSMESNPELDTLEEEVFVGRNNRFIVEEDILLTKKNEIEKIMGKLYAQGVDSLREPLKTTRYFVPINFLTSHLRM